jgi:two-component system sensor histidine kinase UhpB
MSLRLRLIALTSLMLFACIVLGGGLIYRHALDKVETELHAALSVGGRIALNAFHGPGVAAEPRRRLELLVTGFNGDRHVRALLADRDRIVVASSAPLQPERPAPAWFVRLLASDEAVERIELPAVGGYTVRLEAYPANEIAEAWDESVLALKVLAPFCLLAFGLISWLLGTVMRPLNDLTAAFARLGAGDLSPRLSEAGPSELVRLSRGFNEMAERLSAIERQNRNLHEQLEAVQEEERADLARDLHDEIGPFLFAVDVDAAGIQQSAERGRHEEIVRRVNSVREAVGHMRKHLRDILSRLRSPMGSDLGLSHGVENLVQFWQARHPRVVFDLDLPADGFGEALDRTLYRIIQESVSNALRHGRPGRVGVAVRYDAEGAVVASVSDDGGGLQRSGRGMGYGLLGMRERVEALGGTLDVYNRPDGLGVMVQARLPAPRTGEIPGEPAGIEPAAA